MSKPRPTPSRRLTCADVRFVEVDFPRQLRPRLVIEFSEGLSLLLEDEAATPLAAGQLQAAPARDVLLVFTNKRSNRIKLAPEALQLLIDGVDLRGTSFKPWYERTE